MVIMSAAVHVVVADTFDLTVSAASGKFFVSLIARLHLSGVISQLSDSLLDILHFDCLLVEDKLEGLTLKVIFRGLYSLESL